MFNLLRMINFTIAIAQASALKELCNLILCGRGLYLCFKISLLLIYIAFCIYYGIIVITDTVCAFIIVICKSE